MNPLANTEFVFSLGALLFGMGMFNCKRLRDGLSEFKAWCKRSDYMDVLAVLAVLAVILVNWAWY